MDYVLLVDSRCFSFVSSRVYGLSLGSYRTGSRDPGMSEIGAF